MFYLCNLFSYVLISLKLKNCVYPTPCTLRRLLVESTPISSKVDYEKKNELMQEILFKKPKEESPLKCDT